MRSLGALIVSGALPAMMVAAIAAVVSLLLPPITSPFSYLGAAAVALATMRRGGSRGLIVLAGGALVAGVLGSQMLGGGLAAGYSTLVLWLPVWILAMVLRQTTSLAYTLQTAAGLAIAFVIALFALTGDPAKWWQGMLKPLIEAVSKSDASGYADIDFAEMLQRTSEMMTGAMAAVFLVSMVLSILLARAWQAQLFNPGGFREAFHGLRLSPRFALFTLAVMLGGVLLPGVAGAIASQSTFPLLAVFMFAGVGLAHGIVGMLGAGTYWLVGMYVLLMILPVQAGLMLALSGLMDTWSDWRGRISASRSE